MGSPNCKDCNYLLSVAVRIWLDPVVCAGVPLYSRRFPTSGKSTGLRGCRKEFAQLVGDFTVGRDPIAAELIAKLELL